MFPKLQFLKHEKQSPESNFGDYQFSHTRAQEHKEIKIHDFSAR